MVELATSQELYLKVVAQYSDYLHRASEIPPLWTERLRIAKATWDRQPPG